MRDRKVFGDGLVGANVGHGQQMFSRRVLRKDKACRGCERLMKKGELAYGDVTSSAMNRSDRYCIACMEPR